MPSFAASLDASSKIGVVTLSALEDTLTINNPTGEKVPVWMQADIDWYIDTVSGLANTSRVLVVAKQLFPVLLDQRSDNIFYVKGSGAGTLVLWQPE